MNADRLAERLLEETNGALEMFSVYLGDQLGCYRAMAAGEWFTAEGLAARIGAAPRYCEEWLSHQAVREIVEVEDPRAQPRRYRLPAEHVAVLVDPDSLLNGVGNVISLARYARRLPDLVAAYRSGQAPPPLPWGPEGRPELNRAVFRNLLGKQWLPSLPGIDRRLRTPGARVADVACGTGWSSIAIALAYPEASVDGSDRDADAIEQARRHAGELGVADRVRFEVGDAAELGEERRYDLVTIIEALHDVAQPVAVLRGARERLTAAGSVLVIDTRAEDEFTLPASEFEQLEYGYSLLTCLPDAMEPGSAATGMVMRPPALRRYAAEAGFTTVRDLPIDTPYWRFSELTV